MVYSTESLIYIANVVLCYSCNVTRWPFWFGFLLPFLTLYLFDWILFLITFISVFKHKKKVEKQTNTTTSTFQSAKESLIIASSLAVLFGIGWGFGLLATSSSVEAITITFQILFSIFVGLQGLLLFVLHGLRSSEARKVWKQCASAIFGKSRLTFSFLSSQTGSRSGVSSNHSRPLGMTTKKVHCTRPQNVNLAGRPHNSEIKMDLGYQNESFNQSGSYSTTGFVNESTDYQNLTSPGEVSLGSPYSEQGFTVYENKNIESQQKIITHAWQQEN